MRVLRIVLEGTTTSFRFAHFLVGRQPSYPMPPPSTIYGHICSAAGEQLDPAPLRFAYHFQHRGRADDIEFAHLLEIAGGNMDRRLGAPKNIEATPGPLPREVLLYPHLTLYLHVEGRTGIGMEDLFAAFREPYYPVLLGRSQDLASYRSVEWVDLVPATTAYFEGTLLPWSFRGRTNQGMPLLLPRYVHPDDRQLVAWESYLLLERRVFLDPPDSTTPAPPAIRLRRLDEAERVWVDPDTPPWRGAHRAVVWHRFTD